MNSEINPQNPVLHLFQQNNKEFEKAIGLAEKLFLFFK